MSSQQKRTVLLVFGYIQQQSPVPIPFVLIKLMQLFYDVFIYWSIAGSNVAKFLSAQNAESVGCRQMFNIKGIQFGYKMYPNGKSVVDVGMVSPFLRLKHLPSSIQYIGVYYQFKCRQTQCVHNRFKKFYKKKASGIYLMHLSRCKDLKRIDFDCYIDIKYIKYKARCNAMDYIQPMTMTKYVKYKWNIDQDTMAECIELKQNEYILSHSFGGNNWNLRLYYFGAQDRMRIAVDLNCIGVPFGIKYFEAKWKVFLDGDVEMKSKEKITKFEEPHFNGTIAWHFYEKLQKEMPINIEIEILNLWDDDEKIIDEKSWIKYGVIDNVIILAP